ncbi:ufm1-specific protease 1-like [Haliotis asinina]|uniref:ufm1-specific protease 1-like n=1 Tax=Haliotis asinina TaxID=109174 RepID=UPI0035327B1D
MTDLQMNIHEGLVCQGSDVAMVTGDYEYYHYGCDGLDDRGWGCGYRTLQTLCSWVRRQQMQTGAAASHPVPSIPEIQKALVTMEDKGQAFLGSRDWIGSVEVALCIDFFFQIPCRVVHVASGAQLPDVMDQIFSHFRDLGAPVMMGGDSDASSKGIVGACRDPPSLLVVDPHFYGACTTGQHLQDNSWVKWVSLEHFCQKSFYNLCMPVMPDKS